MRAVDLMSQDEADHAKAIEARVGSAFYRTMQMSDRSAYAASNRLGISDIGGCREFVRRTIIDEPYSDEQSDFAPAFMGTAIGALAEKAMDLHGHLEGLRIQMGVVVELTIGNHTLRIPGHPDLVLPEEVWDFKTVDGLGVTRREGPKDRQWFQVMLYAKSLIASGDLPPDCWVSLVFIDRSGGEPQPLVFSRRYDVSVVTQAEEWLADVIYAVENNEMTSRDQPRTWCEKVCPRYTACRQPDTDVEGIIESEMVRDAVKVYQQALEEEKRAKKDKESAASALRNIAGVVPDENGEPWTLRWIHVNPTEVPGFTRSGYDRIHLSKVKAPKPPRRPKNPSPDEMTLDEAQVALAAAQAVLDAD
jgi:hypothetical protein